MELFLYKMEFFAKIVNDWEPLAIFTKSSILDKKYSIIDATTEPEIWFVFWQQKFSRERKIYFQIMTFSSSVTITVYYTQYTDN